ncbi:hypothetical protein GGI23_000818 [Coemansia sp. RSA 2559]|nr:hypothetical protein GGI23_000818 [Coemansia sp. RSA 2559]KAJ2868805.1 hypothetical protein GGI22_000636 [Coemansia erecta]
MKTRGATVNTDTGATSTPLAAKSPEGAVSTRLRSTRTKNKAMSSEEECDSQQLDEQQLMTPTRRSTRTAARKATELIHDVADLLSPRKRATAKKLAEVGEEKHELAADIDTVVMSPRKAGRAATPRSAYAKKTDDESNAEALGSPTPRRRTTRRTPSADSLASTGSTENEETVEEARKKTPARRGRSLKASMGGNTADTTDGTPAVLSLPPPHPELENAAKALASMANWSSKQAPESQRLSPSEAQSVGEGFKTPPESPQKTAVAAVEEENSSLREGGEGEAFVDAVDEISDLSDVDDPHFTEIMSAKAATAAISATGSMAGSEVGGSDDGESDDDDEAPEVVTSKAPEVVASKAPEVVASKTPKAKKSDNKQLDAEETSANKVVAPESGAGGVEAPKQSVRAKKRHRARHRKHAVVVEARKNMATALSDLSKRYAQQANALPSDIPEELRLELHDKLVVDSEKRSATKRSAAGLAGDNKLDVSVLEQFAQQSEKKKRKQKHSNDDAASSAERKRARKEKKNKRKGERASRVVSGINVVATKPASKANLLQTLSQSVPDSVRRFAEEKHGGNRVKRSDPLAAIARSNNQAAISFFK